MRILFVTNSLQTGGAEKVFMLQARELEKRGHEVHMMLLFKKGELAETMEIRPERIHVVGSTSVFDVRGMLRALHVIRDTRPDVLYSTLNEANFVARFVAMFKSTMLITREANMADVKPALYRWGDILFCARSTVILCVSKAVGDSVLRYAPHLKQRIRVLYNPVTMPSEHTLVSHDGVRLLNVGSLTPKKDQQVLVRALALLPPSVSLTLVGDGQERRNLEILARELGVSARINVAGATPPDRVAEFYKSHDIFVLTSTREGCPNVVLEALSYHLPVVAFDIPGMSEFVTPQWGVLVKVRSPQALSDELLPLISSAEARSQKGRAGFEHVRNNHSVDSHVLDLCRILGVPY